MHPRPSVRCPPCTTAAGARSPGPRFTPNSDAVLERAEFTVYAGLDGLAGIERAELGAETDAVSSVFGCGCGGAFL